MKQTVRIACWGRTAMKRPHDHHDAHPLQWNDAVGWLSPSLAPRHANVLPAVYIQPFSLGVRPSPSFHPTRGSQPLPSTPPLLHPHPFHMLPHLFVGPGSIIQLLLRWWNRMESDTSDRTSLGLSNVTREVYLQRGGEGLIPSSRVKLEQSMKERRPGLRLGSRVHRTCSTPLTAPSCEGPSAA